MVKKMIEAQERQMSGASMGSAGVSSASMGSTGVSGTGSQF